MRRDCIINELMRDYQDYLQALYRCGTQEEQERVEKAIKELDKR